MSDHICKYGIETREAPVESYNDLPDQEGEYREDDGKRVELPHGEYYQHARFYL